MVGVILKAHPVHTGDTATPSSMEKVMASMLYLSVCFFSVGAGPIPWIYVSDKFPTRTRHYGLAVASAAHWLFSMFPVIQGNLYTYILEDFVVLELTPTFIADFGYKIFFMFAAINIGGMAVFSVQVNSDVKSQLVSCLSLVSYLKPRGTVWKKSTPYLVPPALRHAKHPLKYKSEKSGRLLGIVPLVQRKSRVTLLSIVLILQRW